MADNQETKLFETYVYMYFSFNFTCRLSSQNFFMNYLVITLITCTSAIQELGLFQLEQTLYVKVFMSDGLPTAGSDLLAFQGGSVSPGFC